MERKALSKARQRGSALMRAAISVSSARIWRARRARISSKDASAVGSLTRRRWFVWAVLRLVSWLKRKTSAFSRSWVSSAGRLGLTFLTSAHQAIIAASMRSVFSRTPIASAKRRTSRGLRIAQGRSCAHRRAKGLFSYPPVASIATRPTPWLWQNAASAATPSAVLAKRWKAPARPMRASRCVDETSTPQMMSVTVTCLVRATAHRATVRSCVTKATVPKLIRGCSRRGNGRPPPREGTGGRPPPRSPARLTPPGDSPDTRGFAPKPHRVGSTFYDGLWRRTYLIRTLWAARLAARSLIRPRSRAATFSRGEKGRRVKGAICRRISPRDRFF